MNEGKTLSVGYGVLDMRAGQPLEHVAMQLEKAYQDKRTYVAWYFDIIHNPNQTPDALRVIGYTKDMIRHASRLHAKNITVRLNTTAEKLRARNELFKKAHENNVRAVEQKVIK
jgi:hypothetical protein